MNHLLSVWDDGIDTLHQMQDCLKFFTAVKCNGIATTGKILREDFSIPSNHVLKEIVHSEKVFVAESDILLPIAQDWSL